MHERLPARPPRLPYLCPCRKPPITPSPLQRRGQRTPTIRENGIELRSSKTQKRTRDRLDRTQTVRHIIRRELVEQAEYILRVETEFAVRDAAAKVERVEVSDADVAAEEDGVRSVQGNDLGHEIGDGVGICAAEPAYSAGHGVHGDMFCVVELYDAVYIRVSGTVEGAEVEEDGRAVGSVGGEEFVEEGCGAV